MKALGILKSVVLICLLISCNSDHSKNTKLNEADSLIEKQHSKKCLLNMHISNKSKNNIEFAFFINNSPEFASILPNTGTSAELKFNCDQEIIEIALVVNRNEQIEWKNGKFFLPDSIDFYDKVHVDSLERINFKFEVLNKKEDLILKSYEGQKKIKKLSDKK